MKTWRSQKDPSGYFSEETKQGPFVNICHSNSTAETESAALCESRLSQSRSLASH